jgi:uncharacterized protein YxjI
MKNLLFPLSLKFNIATLASDFVAKDASDFTIGYVKQKLFKLVEDVAVYADETQATLLYRIKADRWLDFSAVYNFTDADGNLLGKIARKGWASLWKAHYEIFDDGADSSPEYTVTEENAWIKVLDGLLTEIPIVGLFTGYFLNPAYQVVDHTGQKVARIKKEPSLLGRKFVIEKLGSLEGRNQERILLGLMMLVLLERRRG